MSDNEMNKTAEIQLNAEKSNITKLDAMKKIHKK
jgi:hypothetical protein